MIFTMTTQLERGIKIFKLINMMSKLHLRKSLKTIIKFPRKGGYIRNLEHMLLKTFRLNMKKVRGKYKVR